LLIDQTSFFKNVGSCHWTNSSFNEHVYHVACRLVFMCLCYNILVFSKDSKEY